MDTFRQDKRQLQERREDGLPLDAIRQALAGAPEDDLGDDRRRSILDQTLRRPAGSAPAWGLIPLLDLRKALVAAAAVLLAVAVLPLVPPGGVPDPAPRMVPAAADGPDLEVMSDQGTVVLRWSNGSGAHRVIRVTDPQELSTAPARIVEGDHWVDPETNGSPFVFYRVVADS